MVSIAQTTKKYRGRKAETYDEIRQKQRRWKIENETIDGMLRRLAPGSVLDCPVGTGRFMKTYANLSVGAVIGVDASEEMLKLARKKVPRKMAAYCELKLVVGDARRIEAEDRFYDVAVCVRFLDLIEEEAMRAVMKEMMRVARRAIVLTIRLGEKYVPKVNTATHAEKPFFRLVDQAGWKFVERVPVLNAGWEIIRLERKGRK